MSRRSANTLATLAATSALLAGAAVAEAKVTVKDPKRETRALESKGRIDIIRATEDKARGDIVMTATMRERVRGDSESERPVGLVNTRGNRRSRAEYLVYGENVFRNPKRDDAVVIGPATLDADGRTWTYRFGADVIPGLGRFGWAVSTSKRKASDIAPGSRYARSD
jgi:hypothetical protein